MEEKRKATSLKYDSNDVVVKYVECDLDGNDIRRTYAKKKHTQKPLISGVNIKTINGESILGSGNIEVTGIGGSSSGTTLTDLAPVAFSGDYSDLLNKPTIAYPVTDIKINGASIVVDTEANIELPEVPTKLSQLANDVGFITTVNSSPSIVALSELDNDVGFITSSALSGYALASNIPTKLSQLTNDTGFITTVSVNWSDIQDAPAFADVASTGNYNDLLNRPDLSGFTQVQSDWNETNPNEMDYIKNKPTNLSDFNNDVGYLVNHQSLELYAKKTDIPTTLSQLTNNTGFITESALSGYALAANIPTKVSDLSNDSGFISSVSWNGIQSKPDFATVATSGDYNDLLNKPTIPLESDIVNPTNFYSAYSSTSSYSVGDLRYYNGKFYVCKVAIAYPGEEWNSDHWVETKFGALALGVTNVSGTALNSLGIAKVNNPGASMYWRDGTVTRSYQRSHNDDTYVYFENIDIDGNTLTKDTIRVNKTSGGITRSTDTKVILPTPPTTDGTYTIQVTVSDGIPTYSWVLKQ